MEFKAKTAEYIFKQISATNIFASKFSGIFITISLCIEQVISRAVGMIFLKSGVKIIGSYFRNLVNAAYNGLNYTSFARQTIFIVTQFIFQEP